jgi:AraC-like DNA-binding protein
MSFEQNNDNFNFTVTDIDFVVYRVPNKKWKLDSFCNEKFYILGFAVDGQALYTINGEKTDIKKGDILFFQKGQIHSAVSTPENPWAYYSIAFDISFVSPKEISAIEKIPAVHSVKYFAEYANVFQKLSYVWTAKTMGYTIKCRSLIMELLYLIIQEMQNFGGKLSHSRVIEEIRNYMIENYTKTFQIKDLAQMAGMSPSHFRMLFKKHTGQTVIQYQNLLKINKACDLLQSGVCNITEAAYSVGYNDIYYFSRLFKKTVGVSPLAYVKNRL